MSLNIEPTWTIGDGFSDMDVHDNMLDGFTVQDVIDAVHANCPVKDENAVRKTVKEILEIRMQDLEVILNNNAAIIARLAMPKEERAVLMNADEEKEPPAIPAEQVERLAKDIYKWCIKRGYWQDVYIYYNGKRMGTSGMVDGEEVFRYGGEPFIEEGYDAKTYFEYAGPTLSMSFEGPLYHALHHGNRLQYDAESNLRKIFSKYGLYFEYGDYWNLSAFK